jgi:hypothetical protein
MTRASHATHKEMINTPTRWPAWPLLPLVQRKNGHTDYGIITPDYPNVVIKALVFFVNSTEVVLTQLDNDGEVPGMEIIRYQDVDAMLDDSWEVD